MAFKNLDQTLRKVFGREAPEHLRRFNALQRNEENSAKLLGEQEDFQNRRVLTCSQFRNRAAQILHSYELVQAGHQYSRLEKLVRGMPQRLTKCKARRYGRCGK